MLSSGVLAAITLEVISVTTEIVEPAVAAASRHGELSPNVSQKANGEIMVRQFSHVAMLRYQAELAMPSHSGGTSALRCWHPDSYELHNGLWQVVFSQATRVG